MESYTSKEGARDYIKARADLEASLLVEVLNSILPHDSKLLELGIGPGKELRMLSQSFDVTGSDNSAEFLKAFAISNPNFRLLNLDAETIETNLKFDCIFSNKVLHHLSPDALQNSLARQTRVLNPGGILFHSFWLGNKIASDGGLHFCKYQARDLLEQLSKLGEIKLSFVYSDMNPADSFAAAVLVHGGH